MASKTDERTGVESNSPAEVDLSDQRAAEALEQSAKVVTRESDQKLARTAIFDLLSYTRAGQKHLREEGELLEAASHLLHGLAEGATEVQSGVAAANIRDKDERREAELVEKRKRPRC